MEGEGLGETVFLTNKFFQKEVFGAGVGEGVDGRVGDEGAGKGVVRVEKESGGERRMGVVERGGDGGMGLVNARVSCGGNAGAAGGWGEEMVFMEAFFSSCASPRCK